MEPKTHGNVDVGDWPDVAGARQSPGTDRMVVALCAIQDVAHGMTASDETAGRVASILEDALQRKAREARDLEMQMARIKNAMTNLQAGDEGLVRRDSQPRRSPLRRRLLIKEIKKTEGALRHHPFRLPPAKVSVRRHRQHARPLHPAERPRQVAGA